MLSRGKLLQTDLSRTAGVPYSGSRTVNTVSQQDCVRALYMAEQCLCATENTVALFPKSMVKPLLAQHPRFCCQAVGKETEGVAQCGGASN